MPHELNALGNPIRHTRKSPRTQGVTEEGKTFQKFGTQQLKFIDPAKPALGVREIDVGATFKGFTTSGYTGTKTTVFSERFQAGITGAVPVALHEEAVTRQKEKLEEMGIPIIQFPDLTTLFPPASPTGNGTGCECEACKNGTGVCSDKRPECNAWDIGCELFGLPNGNGKPTPTCTTCDSDKCKECNAWDVGCELSHMASGTCTPPVTPPTPTCECEACKNGTGECSDKKPCCNAWDILCEMGGECSKPPKPNECGCLPFDIGCELGCWWEKNKNYVYIIGGLIGIGVLLWLLRPLFGIAKNITGN